MSTVRVGRLATPGGKLSSSIFLPDVGYSPRHWIVHVPAFAEEMNKSRAMVGAQARQLADAGLVVVVPDLYGTGDSEGDFSEADWNRWKSDIEFLIHWARDQGAQRITLWGLRLGCLLALDLLQQPCEGVAALLLWQPVLNGKLHMGQFLRLRMASSLMTGDTETVAQLRDQLLKGQSIEVAGYRLSSEMFQQIEAVDAAKMSVSPGLSIRVLEVVTSEERPPLPLTLKQVERWQGLGLDCLASSHLGDPFWMTQEIAYAHRLTSVSCAYLTHPGGGGEPVAGESAMPELFPAPDAGPGEPEAVIFPCAGEELVGMLHRVASGVTCGVLIVVGGPQYRTGSHRQFVYLARALADRGIPVFRFDYRGMGDSSGKLSGFNDISEDIACAIDAFQHSVEDLAEVVIWGLCDAATASVFYASGDERINGLVLVNPWVYSSQGAAKAYLKHYYLGRLLSRGFWRKVFKGEYNPFASMASLVEMISTAFKSEPIRQDIVNSENSETPPNAVQASGNLVQRFSEGLARFKKPVLIILSGNDLTAAEFSDAAAGDRQLSRVLARSNLRTESVSGADHTFSNREWRVRAEQLTIDWYRSL